MAASILLCGLQLEALSLCATKASEQCSSCLVAGSEYLRDPKVADGILTTTTSSHRHGSCDALKTEICWELESLWSDCAACDDEGSFCGAELQDLYQCALMTSAAAHNLDCDEEFLYCSSCFDSSESSSMKKVSSSTTGSNTPQKERCDEMNWPSSSNHQQHSSSNQQQQQQRRELQFVEGLLVDWIAGFFNWFFYWLSWSINLVDFFNIIPDPQVPPTPAPTLVPTPGPFPTPSPFPTTTPAPFVEDDPAPCREKLAQLRSCVNNAKNSNNANERSCANCVSSDVAKLLPPAVENPSDTPCEDLKLDTCSRVDGKWSQCNCFICEVLAEQYYGCLVNAFNNRCNDNLCCFGERCGECGVQDADGTCADCFSPHNTVDVKHKGTIPIGQIQIGDLVSINEKGEYSRVYSLGHLDDRSMTDYLQIFGEGLQQPLEISPNHLLYANGKVVPASQVKIGDTLNGNGIRVSKVATIQRRGKYAPLTETGTVRVSGVEVSNYIRLSTLLPEPLVSLSEFLPSGVHHMIGHGWTAPLRWTCALNFDVCRNETYENGYASWFHATLRFSSKVGELPRPVQLGIALVVIALAVALYYSSSLLLAAAVLVLLFRNARYKQNTTHITTKGRPRGIPCL